MIHSVFITFVNGKLAQPSPHEDLVEGIKFAHARIANPLIDWQARDALSQWAVAATAMLDQLAVTQQHAVAVKYPEHCKVCNHHNPYAGAEHMTTCGSYVCRQCRPAWDRKERISVLKEEEALREAQKAICG